jgi:hypothetical protein
MEKNIESMCARADPPVEVTIGKAEDCWKSLAALIAKRADAIYRRRASAGEEGPEIWKLAEAQIEKPLCCGMLRLDHGWLISLNSANLGSGQIEICAEPHRLIVLGRKQARASTGVNEVAVRVLKLPNEVSPEPVKIRQHGPIIDVELRDCTAADLHTTAAAA